MRTVQRHRAVSALASLWLLTVSCRGEEDCRERAECPVERDRADAGNTDGSPPPVPGNDVPPSLLALKPLPNPTFVIQGGATTVPLELERGAQQQDAVTISVEGLPAGVTAPEVTIARGALSGKIEVTTVAEMAQGPYTARLKATSGGVEATADLPLFVRGRPGATDTTFSNGGTYTHDPQTYFDPREVFVLPDHKVLFVGSSGTPSPLPVALRLNPDGSLDTTYGSGGIAKFAHSAGAFVLQGDKLVGVGGPRRRLCSRGSAQRGRPIRPSAIRGLSVSPPPGKLVPSGGSRSHQTATSSSRSPSRMGTVWASPGSPARAHW